jgi:hypothetical protein
MADQSSRQKNKKQNYQKSEVIAANQTIEEQPASSKKRVSRIQKSGVINLRMSKELYNEIGLYSSYNKILKKTPDTASGVIAAATSMLIEKLDISINIETIRHRPDKDYIARLELYHQAEKTTGNIPKSFSLPVQLIDKIDMITAYNRYHSLKPDVSVDLVRDALMLYFDSIDIDFHPMPESNIQPD